MNKSRHEMSRRLVLSARQLYFYQQQTMKKLSNTKGFSLGDVEQHSCDDIDVEDNENYLLGYN